MRSQTLYATAMTLMAVLPNTHAADNCSGYDILVTQSTETVDLGKNMTLTVMRQHSILTSESTPIYHLMTGECTASILSTPDGKVRASGHCARRDKDGDTSSIHWEQAPGATKSTWEITGGSGKFAQLRGSGWFEELRMDGKIVAGKWGGTCR